MKQLHNIVAPLILFCLMAAVSLPVLAQEQEGEAVSQQTQDEITPKEEQENTVDVKEIVFGHIGDSYEWHITTWGNTHITIPLPIIVYSSTTGWHTFLSSRLEENGGTYEGLSIAPEGSKYEGKLVEYNAAGGPPVGYFHHESDICFAVQQRVVAHHRIERVTLVQKTSARSESAGRIYRIHGDVHHDGERRYYQELCRTQLPEVCTVSADSVLFHLYQ